jgi:hypothetical protein
MKIMSLFARHANIYRIIVAVGFIAAMALSLAFPVKMIGASPWSYYYGVRNFAEGKLVVDDRLHAAQVADAKQQGGSLQQYVDIGNNKWALEKAPGYVFYQVPFEWAGITRWGNVVLALGMTIVTYILLKRIRDEKTACIGSLLMLFTPVSLIMLNLTYMDTFASLAFLVMGGGLYFYYHMERNRLRPVTGGILLFIAFLLISWSVVTRYTNFPVTAIFALHYVITRLISWRKGENIKLISELPAVTLGIGLPLAALLWYDYIVFGSPLDYGYNYTRFPIKFAYQYLGQIDKNGQSIPLQIILGNLKSAPKALFWGYPLLVIGIPGICAVSWQKFIAWRKRGNPDGLWGSLDTELPWDILLVLIGCFISMFGLYIMYEFTAEYLGESSSLIRFARFYLPGLFPVAVVCALVMARIPYKFYIPILVAAVIVGSYIYYDYIDGDSASGDSWFPQRTHGIQQPARGISDNITLSENRTLHR